MQRALPFKAVNHRRVQVGCESCRHSCSMWEVDDLSLLRLIMPHIAQDWCSLAKQKPTSHCSSWRFLFSQHTKSLPAGIPNYEHNASMRVLTTNLKVGLPSCESAPLRWGTDCSSWPQKTPSLSVSNAVIFLKSLRRGCSSQHQHDFQNSCWCLWDLWKLTRLWKRAPLMGHRPQLSHSTPWCTNEVCPALQAALLCALLRASVFCAFPIGMPAGASG